MAAASFLMDAVAPVAGLEQVYGPAEMAVRRRSDLLGWFDADESRPCLDLTEGLVRGGRDLVSGGRWKPPASINILFRHPIMTVSGRRMINFNNTAMSYDGPADVPLTDDFTVLFIGTSNLVSNDCIFATRDQTVPVKIGFYVTGTVLRIYSGASFVSYTLPGGFAGTLFCLTVHYRLAGTIIKAYLNGTKVIDSTLAAPTHTLKDMRWGASRTTGSESADPYSGGFHLGVPIGSGDDTVLAPLLYALAKERFPSLP